MAKYQQYDDYKELQSIFVEKIPMHWNIEPLYALCGFKQGKAHEPFIDDDGEFICVNARFVSTQGQGNSIKRCSVNLTPAKLYDILMVMSDLPNGRALARAFYVEELKNNYAVNQRVCAITAKKVHAKFLYYQLNRSPYFLMFNDGSNQTHLSNDAYKKYPVLLPSTIEQVQIANFLDYETAQIDTLIDKQQTLIQLLKEKRQAVISHAVTKGLNPDAPMKDSGVEWLGEVPEHWVVTKFSHCAQIRNGLVDPKAPDFKNLVLYAPNHIEKGTGKIVYKETAEEQGADSSKYLCYKGEVIYSKIRPALAKVAICEEETALCSADMYPINAVNGLDNRFLYFFMLSDNFTKAAILDSDRVAMPKINRESLSDYRLPVPPVIEQMAICNFIANQNTKLEELESKATKAIQLMQERRTALISAAVTGKIDVRGWVAPE